jgi:polysaccharide biosynthesis/export protein
MFKAAALRVTLIAVSAIFLGILSGCSSGPTSGFSLFPQGHKLTETAKSLRDANAHALAIPRELEKQPLLPYTVEPGDVLLVQPLDLDSPVRIGADQPVLPDGTINLGKYGQLLVMGRTVPEIESLVQASIKPHVKDVGFISVRLISRVSKVYYVIGAVNSPGSFPLQGRETVLDAIMQAGGLTDDASRDNIILSRPTQPHSPRIVLPVCWKHVVQHGDSTTNYQIAPGDRVYVPSRTLAETIPGLNRCVKSPCKCNIDSPHVFPPYGGHP